MSGTFQVRELDTNDGSPAKTVAFTGNVRPFGYTELIEARSSRKPLTIPIELDEARIVETNVSSLDRSQSYRVAMKLESTFTSRVIGLVKGGWLPPAFAVENTMMLPDRNVVSEIVGRFGDGRTTKAAPDFLDLFADSTVRINPLLFAMEGNKREVPSPEVVRDQLQEVVTKLKTALPHCTLSASEHHLKGALGLIEDSRVGFARRQQFLMRLAPKLAAPISRARVTTLANEVLLTADECGVVRGSLTVLAALSSVAVPNGRSPAKKVLKFKIGYSEQDAYNALADLRSLELLIALFASFPAEPAMLCTADRSLALFWVGLRASNFELVGGKPSFSLSPVEELLPASAMPFLASFS